MTARALAMLVGMLAATGCAKSPRALYVEALEAHTEMLLISHNFGTGLRLRGTYLSDSFRQDVAEERRRLLHVTEDDHTAFLARMVSDASAYHEVVFTAETGIVDTKVKFGDTDDTFRLRLTADGQEQPLVTVYKVDRTTPLHEALWAHKNMFNELWIARFHRGVTDPSRMELHVGSGFGAASITFTSDQLR